MSEAEELARRVDAAVAAVEGVQGVYASRPVVARVLREARDADAARASVSIDADGPVVVVSVGIDAEPAAGETARRVAEAARAAVGDDAARVTVRVSRIAPASAF